MYKFLLIFLISAVSCAYHPNASKQQINEPHEREFDIVIVPGIPFENGKWSKIMKGRVYWSKFLYDRGITENVMFSGGAVYTPYVEAEIMAMYAEKLGIDKKNIYTETMAEHSTENVYYSYKKARKLGFKKIGLASDPFQSKMLRSFIKKRLKNDVHVLPFVTDSLKAMEPYMTDPEIDYQKAFVSDFRNIKQRESWRERFRGTRGLKIDTAAYN